MKEIVAVIRPEKLDAVCDALDKIGYPGVMITEIAGRGHQKGMTKILRGRKYHVEFITKTKMDVVVKDEDEDKVIDTILKAAHSGEVGDGKVFVSFVEKVVRIRTSERDNAAL